MGSTKVVIHAYLEVPLRFGSLTLSTASNISKSRNLREEEDVPYQGRKRR